MRISDWSSDVCSSDLNAAFDVGFLDHELSRLGDHYGRIRDRAQVLDSLEMARQRYPGQRNSLDALCRRLGVDNSHRQQHGALLDAQLLAEAYLALTAGQSEIGFASVEVAETRTTVVSLETAALQPRPQALVDDADLAAHAARLEAIRTKAGRAIWALQERTRARTFTLDQHGRTSWRARACQYGYTPSGGALFK